MNPMTAMSSQDNMPKQALATVLERVRAELSGMQQLMLDVEHMVARMMAKQSDADVLHAYVIEVQQLDVLAQRIAGLGEYVGELASVMPQDWEVDPSEAATILKLADQMKRLTGVEGDERGAGDPNEDIFF